MPEPKRPLKVFLCHASADKPAVRNLYQRLIADGVDVWLDAESLIAGQNWQVEIPKAIRNSDVVIVCLSERSINKEGYVQREIKFALDVADEKPEGTIFIIPARLEECRVPDRLNMYHWVELFEKDGYERLLRALRMRADKIGATLQLKKKWLPIGNTQPAVIKIPSLSIEKANESEKENHEQGLVYKTSSSKHKLNLKRTISVMVQGALVVMAVTGLILTFWNPIIPKPSFLDSAQVDTTTSFTAQPSETLTMIQTETSTVTPTSLPTEITDTKGVSMLLVPAGVFLMGSDEFEDREKPSHTVDLPAYYIDKFEATNKFYKDCVDAGWCIPPAKSSSATRPSYYGNPEFDDYPVSYINWNMAKGFCDWRGARLPTEAEWEKAARGSNGRNYPWGNALNCDYANYQGCNKDTTMVGSYESGKSPYGVYDMAGNVWEWVNDWYDEKYYLTLGDNSFNPLGPTEGDARILHGGAWYYINGPNVRSSLRGWESPDVWDLLFGVRCAWSAPQSALSGLRKGSPDVSRRGGAKAWTNTPRNRETPFSVV